MVRPSREVMSLMPPINLASTQLQMSLWDINLDTLVPKNNVSNVADMANSDRLIRRLFT